MSADTAIENQPSQLTPLTGLSKLAQDSTVWKVLSDLTIFSNARETVSAHITTPFDRLTPKEKVKKRPDGYDYIESSWMDKEFKTQSPLYATELVHYSEGHGWITIVVRLTDRVTGNSELGASSARIMVKSGTGLEPTFKDIIDKGNNVASALTKAIKNAQSRFGIGADVYGKRESVITDAERERYESMLKIIKSLAPAKAQIFAEQWKELGTDYTDYLDKWQTFVDRTKRPAEDLVTGNNKSHSSSTSQPTGKVNVTI